MKHKVKGKKLNRDSQSRRALFKNLFRSLIEHQSIKTDLAKAKAIQAQFDTLINRAKKGTLHDRRQIDKVINNRSLVNQLVDVIAPATKNRLSGFTRIVRINKSLGDNAVKVRLELVDMTKKVIEKPSSRTASKKTKLPAKVISPKIPAAKIETNTGLKINAPQSVATPQKTVRKTP